MKRGGPLRRGKRLRPVNPERRDRLWVEQYESEERVEWVRSLPCTVCRRRPSDNAHVRGKGAGGKARDIIPLCREHHTDGSDSWHQLGRRSFAQVHGIDSEQVAADTERRWRERQWREAA